jgi:hypothetical protein
MLCIPSMTQAIFGGASGMADGMSKVVSSVVEAAVSLGAMAAAA